MRTCGERNATLGIESHEKRECRTSKQQKEAEVSRNKWITGGCHTNIHINTHVYDCAMQVLHIYAYTNISIYIYVYMTMSARQTTSAVHELLGVPAAHSAGTTAAGTAGACALLTFRCAFALADGASSANPWTARRPTTSNRFSFPNPINPMRHLQNRILQTQRRLCIWRASLSCFAFLRGTAFTRTCAEMVRSDHLSLSLSPSFLLSFSSSAGHEGQGR